MEATPWRMEKQVHTAANRVRYTMNGFVIAVGVYVAPLKAKSRAVAKAIGPVSVDMGETACQVPLASGYIDKMEARGSNGRKRKSALC